MRVFDFGKWSFKLVGITVTGYWSHFFEGLLGL